MKAGWVIKPLGKVCSLLNRGISPKYLESGGLCVLNQKCIRDHEVSFGPSRRHDGEQKRVAPERFIRRGDVLVNSTGTGTLGRVAQVKEEPPEPTTVDSHVTIVRPLDGLFFEDFFGYMLVVIEEAIKEAGEGCGGQIELARSVLSEKFFVSYPTDLSTKRLTESPRPRHSQKPISRTPALSSKATFIQSLARRVMDGLRQHLGRQRKVFLQAHSDLCFTKVIMWKMAFL
jgi:type I restriction enzyme S subunit